VYRIGQNPTGGTLSVERRKEIYALCQQYDVIIVEDEPYWNLQFPSAYEMEARHRGSTRAFGSGDQNYNENGNSSGYAFLDSLVPSYLSIDTEGRVVRLDTFSKTIAPGSRLGWVTAQPAVIERLTRITETSTQQPSGFVQSLIAEMMMGKQKSTKGNRVKKEDGQGWHMDGWVRWLEGLRGGYEKRMTDMCDILEENKYLLSQQSDDSETTNDHVNDWEVVDRIQMFDFVWPKAGMFAWVEILLDNHPLISQYSAERLSKALWIHLTKKPYLCLVGPGSMFATTEKSAAQAHKYIRIAFAPMDAEDVIPFTRRLVEGLRAFWQRKNLDGLEDEDAAMAMQNLRLGHSANLLGSGC